MTTETVSRRDAKDQRGASIGIWEADENCSCP